MAISKDVKPDCVRGDIQPEYGEDAFAATLLIVLHLNDCEVSDNTHH